MNTQVQEKQEKLRNICKDAVKDCMRSAQFMNYRESSQIEHFANVAYNKAEYDKPDQETFLKVWIAAYTKGQELLIQKPPAFSLFTSANPSQLAQHMLWEQKVHETFDAAYVVVSERVEAAVGIVRQEEVTP